MIHGQCKEYTEENRADDRQSPSRETQEYSNPETEHEIMEEIDEAKKRWDEELEAMKHPRGQHSEDQNESTEIISFSRSGIQTDERIWSTGRRRKKKRRHQHQLWKKG